jgi:2-polyprenyl-6-methoxyphenol hydroxylase-like FAD-dependent oxidoreductase
MGVPKAAGDAIALVEAIQQSNGVSPDALRAFEAERLRISANIIARGRYLGAYMEAQLKSAEERRRAQEARLPERVMMETAAPWDYETAFATKGTAGEV